MNLLFLAIILLNPVRILSLPSLSSECQNVDRFWHQITESFPTQSPVSRRRDDFTCTPALRDSQSSCCSDKMLLMMADITERGISTRIVSRCTEYSDEFRDDTIRLKQHITETLGSTIANLDSQFKADFGYNYSRHKQVLLDFIATIQSYLFGTSDIRIEAVVHNFFDELLLHMTQILLLVKDGDDLSYAKCVANLLKPRRPFDRAPEIIMNMTLEAFPSVRLAINALAFASEALGEVSKSYSVPPACISKHMHLRFCSLCAGYVNVLPCEDECAHLADLCISQQAALSTAWREFTSALRDVLLHLYKFPLVHRPLQMHLTDGIMSLKSVFSRHETEIISNCSSLESAANRPWSRTARQAFEKQPPAAWPGFGHLPQEEVSVIGIGLGNLKTWAQSVEKKYGERSNFFESLTQDVCNSSTSQSNEFSHTCWNGTSLEKTSTPVDSPGVHRKNTRLADPGLLQIDANLRIVAANLRSVLHFGSEPNLFLIADTEATKLTVIRDGRHFRSDQEALFDFFNPVQKLPTATQQPDYSNRPPNWPNPDFIPGVDTESSGFDPETMNRPPIKDLDPRSPLLANLDRSLSGSDQYAFPYPSSLENFDNPLDNSTPVYPLDDEDFKQRINEGQPIENSGYVPPDLYESKEQPSPDSEVPVPGMWPPHPGSDASYVHQSFDGPPSSTWERDPPESLENSGELPSNSWSSASNIRPYSNLGQLPDNKREAVESRRDAFDKFAVGNTGLSGLSLSDRHQLPSQIWVPEGHAVVHMSVPPPSTTSSATEMHSYGYFTQLCISSLLFLLFRTILVPVI